MVEFETLWSDRVHFNDRNFIEVNRKVAIDGDQRHEFLSIARGFLTRDGTERWKTNLTIPDDADVVEEIQAMLDEVKPNDQEDGS